MIEVRSAEGGDVPGIVKVWLELMEYHREMNDFFTLREGAEAAWESFLRKRMADSLVLVASDEGAIVGYCIAAVKEYPPLFLEQKHGFISDMCVSAEHRRKGIGSGMMAQAFEWFASQGIDRVELRVEHDNEVGKAFWRRQGFSDEYYTMLRLG